MGRKRTISRDNTYLDNVSYVIIYI